jgi:radical SAM superfamily enzyme YgiQ (UPF0313 family)
MKVLICALNTKYVHSSLASWCLKAGVDAYTDCECKVYESTINESPEKILSCILSEEFDIIGFCTYIWNKETVLYLSEKIKEMRGTTIVLGGPEVSYNAGEILRESPFVDYVISGEGEEIFARLCSGESAENIPGVSYRRNGKIIEKPPYVSEKTLPSPYTDEYFDSLKGRISYIETSRGCPFSCAFCLSGRSCKVRFFDIDEAKKNILKLANSGTKTVKFVDRTFNADRKRAREIFKFIIDNYGVNIPKGVCFHFELEGELIDDETIELLSKAPKGIIQVEIGLQSFNEETLRAINRKTNIPLLCKNIRKILQLENIHTHIDLIAGLPKESMDSFENSFNRALELKPHMLQLGFLKLLYGSELRENPEHVFEFNKKPPYEVISTPCISREELALLHKVEDVFERTYNSLRFPNTVSYLHSLYESPFQMYKAFSLYLENKDAKTLDKLTYEIYRFFSTEAGINKEKLRDMLVLDRLSTNRMGALPEFLKVKTPVIKDTLNQLEKDEKTKRKTNIKRAATVLTTTSEFIYVDYDECDPVTGQYKINRIKLESIF